MRQRILYNVIFAILLIFVNKNSFSADFTVKSSQELSDALLTAGENGENDLIKIYQGTYYGNFVFASKQKTIITLRGGYYSDTEFEEDPSKAVLEGDNDGKVINCANYGDIVIENMTITKGSKGGIHAFSWTDEKGQKAGNIVLRNCIVTNNGDNTSHGGGIYAESQSLEGTSGFIALIGNTLSWNKGGAFLRIRSKSESPWGNVLLQNNTITFNNTPITGGGVYIWLTTETGKIGKVTLNDNRIKQNTAGGDGGGVFIEEERYGLGMAASETITFENNTINDNFSKTSGGGVYIEAKPRDGIAASINFFGNTISGNESNNGGGVFVRSGSKGSQGGNIMFGNNIVSQNKANDSFGGLKATSHGVASGTVTLVNNIITDNHANNRIGGVHALATDTLPPSNDVILTNNTISGNEALNKTGGLLLSGYNNDTYVYNNIIWGNRAPSAGDIRLIENFATFHGYNNNYSDMDGEWSNASDNMDHDPQFIGGGNYHLKDVSPCIDAGTKNAPKLPSIDIDGQNRIHGSAPDIGADEI